MTMTKILHNKAVNGFSDGLQTPLHEMKFIDEINGTTLCQQRYQSIYKINRDLNALLLIILHRVKQNVPVS